MKCSICSRPRTEDSEYCKYHHLANLNLRMRYRDWERAYGSLSWESYLESVSKLSESGKWVREVTSRELCVRKENRPYISRE